MVSNLSEWKLFLSLVWDGPSSCSLLRRQSFSHMFAGNLPHPRAHHIRPRPSASVLHNSRIAPRDHSWGPLMFSPAMSDNPQKRVYNKFSRDCGVVCSLIRVLASYMMHQTMSRAAPCVMVPLASMLQKLCDNGGDAGLDPQLPPLKSALVDGNFDQIWMQRGLSVSDWLRLRVKSSSLRGIVSFVLVGKVDPRIVRVMSFGSFQHNFYS